MGLSEVCSNHKDKPVKIYCKCVGCEIENLRHQVKELQELVKYFKTRVPSNPESE